jgi:hypothetical protein
LTAVTPTAPRPDEDAPDSAEPAPGWGLSPRRARAWLAANRAKAELLLIGGIAIGGIVCMMVITVVVLIVQLRR